MTWKIEYIKEAQRDLLKLDPYNRRIILKAIEPLGHHASSNLTGYYKIKLRDLGYRVVYGLVREKEVMKVIVISIRDEEAVYQEAERRIEGLVK